MSLEKMAFGAVLSALLAVAYAVVLRERRMGVLVTVGVAALGMPLFWNSVLNWTGATGMFSHDLPFPPFPISWQDAGSGIFTLAGAAPLLMLAACRKDPPRRIAVLSIAAALAALIVDVYFY